MMYFFDSLESRRYLSVQIIDVITESEADNDGDGAIRGAIVSAYLQSTTQTTVYLKGFEDDGGSGDDLIFRSPLIAVGPSGASYTAPTFADLYSLPGDDSDGWVEFRVEVYDAVTNALLASRSWNIDDDLGPVPYEHSSNDGGTFGIAPTILTPAISPGANLSLGDTFEVTSRVIDSSPTGHDIEGAYFWVDLNRNSTFDPVSEGPTLRRMSLQSGTSQNGTWRVLTQATMEFGIGSLRGMVTSWDFDANPRNSPGIEFTVAAVDTPPVVNSALVNVPFVNNGDPFSITVTATDNNAVTSIESFVDYNRNSTFDAADYAGPTDLDSSNGWILNFVDSPQYVNQSNIRVGVRALDALGQSSPWTFAEVRHNAPPSISIVTIDGVSADGTPRLFGTNLTVRATATDDTGLPLAVTFFVDKNNDSLWTPGVDVDLGADFVGADGFSRTVPVTTAWGTPQQVVRVAAAAVDVDNAWSTITRTPFIRLNERPAITNLVASSTNVLANALLTITATLQDSNPRAVTFFRDVNLNGAWDAFIDQDLGADQSSVGGWTRQITVYPSWIAAATIRIVADVVDIDGVWGTTPRAFVTVNVLGPAVLGVVAPAMASFGQTVSVSATASGLNAIRAVTFFLDQNNNGIWNSGVDVDLGADFDSSGGWTKSFTVNSTWGTGNQKVIRAAAVDVLGNWSVPVAATPMSFVDKPVVTNVTPSSQNVTAGTTFSYQAVAQYERGVRAVTSFIDTNGDGRWTSGVDIDLGVSTLTQGSATSGTWTRSFTWTYGPGIFRIVIDAVGLNGNWSGRPYSIQISVRLP